MSIVLQAAKFQDPDVTATGAQRAFVDLVSLNTLWFNTGTLCNIECHGCYIESSPANDRLSYIRTSEVEMYLDEITELGWSTEEIGFTGGEPFMNPEIVEMVGASLGRGFRVLILTNAMQPMLRPHLRAGLLELLGEYGDRLVLRVSLDHFTAEKHEVLRGPGTWERTLDGLRWLAASGFALNVAGRTCWPEPEAELRAGFARLFEGEGVAIDAECPASLVLFPEMDLSVEVPEITVDCWNILGKRPEEVMCATSRMVVKRRGSQRPSVVACTLIPYDPRFEMGETLAEVDGAVKLNHPHCAKFCVLGGGSCSVARG